MGLGEHEEAARPQAQRGLCSGFGTLLLVPAGWVLEHLARGAGQRPASQHVIGLEGAWVGHLVPLKVEHLSVRDGLFLVCL